MVRQSRDMEAAIIAAPGDLARVARPEPGPRELRVRLEGCGVCGSNLASWEGRPWFTSPLSPGEPGHEGWGEVDAVGDDVQKFRLGDFWERVGSTGTARKRLRSRFGRNRTDLPRVSMPRACVANLVNNYSSDEAPPCEQL